MAAPLSFSCHKHTEAPDLHGKHEYMYTLHRHAVACAAKSLWHMLKMDPSGWALLGGLFPPRGAPVPPLSPSQCPELLSLGPGQSHQSPAVLFLFGAHCRMPKGPEQRDSQPGVPAAAERPARQQAHLRDALQLPGKAQPSGSPLCSAAQRTPSQSHPPVPKTSPTRSLPRGPAGAHGKSRAVICTEHVPIGWSCRSLG